MLMPNDIWDLVYWFARFLVNSDQYGGIGAKSQRILNISSATRRAVESAKERIQQGTDVDQAVSETSDLVRAAFAGAARNGTKVQAAAIDLAEAIIERCQTLDHFNVLIFTIENVVVPTNSLLLSVPSSDREFTESTTKQYLNQLGEAGLPTVINFADDAGTTGSLAAERALVVQAFSALRFTLEQSQIVQKNADIILSAFIQEVERRIAQKRKTRAGESLESVTGLILAHFNIATTDRPEHFQADIEIDKWVRTRDRWLIGISCKRTLRERWKQLSTADYSTLGRYKIRELWHVITYSNDLSVDKVTHLGAGKQIFYLPDDSKAYALFSTHPGTDRYVRKMSSFISDLRDLL